MEHLNVREFRGMGTFLALWMREIEGLEFHVWRMRERGENFGHDLWSMEIFSSFVIFSGKLETMELVFLSSILSVLSV